MYKRQGNDAGEGERQRHAQKRLHGCGAEVVGGLQQDVYKRQDRLSCPPLTFAAPDEETFRCLKLARQCAAVGGTACAILNGANEEAVGAFLRDAVGFNDIPALVEAALETVEQVSALTLEEILAADHAAREAVRAHI